ncbi:hypothetical protein M3629_04680 [Paenibacillus polysaccharolyticus]|uniref:hypothetical protein n=1 Tax=Paenibacillus polysaccharolyticus TaxID=582692 RepID=UPI002040F763|nr:hypothetical protein [Paenibacillus polysaccharolyticus]MCM3132067.1 hypothetical protein [Paenibacillus polysaccharolyticus]
MRYMLGLLWVAFIAYALFMAPGNSPGNDPIFKELLTLQSKEPWLLTVFSWLGIFPAVYACILLRKSVTASKGQRIPAWPFVLFSFGLGAFALLPYFALVAPSRIGIHEPVPTVKQSKRGVPRLASHKLTHLILLLLTLGSALYALTEGNPDRFVDAFYQSSFVHIMTIDFAVLTLLSMYAIFRDARANGRTTSWAWAGLLPLAGPLLYLLTERK